MPAKSAEGVCAKQMRVQTFEQRSSVSVQNGKEKNGTAQQRQGRQFNDLKKKKSTSSVEVIFYLTFHPAKIQMLNTINSLSFKTVWEL